MKKVIIIFCIIVLLSPSLSFAQSERRGAIIGTFGLGLASRTTVKQETLGSVIFDLNLISPAGFTLSFTDATVFSTAGTSRYIMPGVGYNYMRDRWNIGGAIHVAPMAGDLLIAGKINGSYYFFNNIGITGILMYGRVAGMMGFGFSMFNVFTGISIRLF